MMTELETFMKVKSHLLTQLERCEDEIGTCLYRGKDGMMCAVGCLILDEHYYEEFEGKSVCDPIVVKALIASGVPIKTEDICRCSYFQDYEAREGSLLDNLSTLQNMHDCANVEEWPERLNNYQSKWF